MFTFLRPTLLLCFLLSLTTASFAQNVAVNATGATPNASAGLDVDFTNKGLLLPRVSLTSALDVTTIPSPATGLMVYNLGTGGTSPNDITPGQYYFNGTKWVRYAAGWINANSVTNMGKFYIGPFNLAANTNVTFTITDPNVTTASQISISFAGQLPGSNAQNMNIRIYNVQCGTGQFVIQLTNLNLAVNYTNLQLAYTAIY